MAKANLFYPNSSGTEMDTCRWHLAHVSLIKALILTAFLHLLTISIPLDAQDSLFYAPALPELTELNYENAELQNWVIVSDSMLAFTPDKTGLDFRTSLLPQTKQLTNKLLFSSVNSYRNCQSSFRGVYYQKLKRNVTPLNKYQITMLNSYPKLHFNLALGCFRLQAGEGLCLGSYLTKINGKDNLLNPSQSLSHPNFTGMAAFTNLHKTNVALWMSKTHRFANLEEGRIETLYESSLSEIYNKDNITENTNGIIIRHTLQQNQFGAYYYHQNLNKGYTDKDISSNLAVIGLFSDINIEPFIIGAETFRSNNKIAGALRFEHQTNKLTNVMHYFYTPLERPLSYSKTSQIFGQNTGSEEIDWDIVYKFSSYFDLIGRMAVCKDLSGNTDIQWKERTIVSANWKNHIRHFTVTYYRYRKDDIAGSDTLNANILPVQNRIKATWKQAVTTNLTYTVSGQYQHYLDKKTDKSGISIYHSIRYSTGKLDCYASYNIWSNQRSTYQNTELTDNDDYLTQSESDSAFKIGIKYPLGNRIKVNLQGYIPIIHTRYQSYNCSITTVF